MSLPVTRDVTVICKCAAHQKGDYVGIGDCEIVQAHLRAGYKIIDLKRGPSTTPPGCGDSHEKALEILFQKQEVLFHKN